MTSTPVTRQWQLAEYVYGPGGAARTRHMVQTVAGANLIDDPDVIHVRAAVLFRRSTRATEVWATRKPPTGRYERAGFYGRRTVFRINGTGEFSNCDSSKRMWFGLPCDSCVVWGLGGRRGSTRTGFRWLDNRREVVLRRAAQGSAAIYLAVVAFAAADSSAQAGRAAPQLTVPVRLMSTETGPGAGNACADAAASAADQPNCASVHRRRRPRAKSGWMMIGDGGLLWGDGLDALVFDPGCTSYCNGGNGGIFGGNRATARTAAAAQRVDGGRRGDGGDGVDAVYDPVTGRVDLGRDRRWRQRRRRAGQRQRGHGGNGGSDFNYGTATLGATDRRRRRQVWRQRNLRRQRRRRRERRQRLPPPPETRRRATVVTADPGSPTSTSAVTGGRRQRRNRRRRQR